MSDPMLCLFPEVVPAMDNSNEITKKLVLTFSSASDEAVHRPRPFLWYHRPFLGGALAASTPWSDHTWRGELLACVYVKESEIYQYRAQKWSGVSLSLLQTLIEAPFSKRRLTTWCIVLSANTSYILFHLCVAITSRQEEWSSSPAIFQAQHLNSPSFNVQELLKAGALREILRVNLVGQLNHLNWLLYHLNAGQGPSAGSDMQRGQALLVHGHRALSPLEQQAAHLLVVALHGKVEGSVALLVHLVGPYLSVQ